MQKEIQYAILRNPLYVFGCYLFLLLPEFINSCSHRTVITSFWNNIPVCSKEFVFTKFLGNSIWSIILLIFVFEVFRMTNRFLKAQAFPVSVKNWVQFELKILGSTLLAFMCYVLLALLFAWFTHTLDEISISSIFYKSLIVGIVGIHGVMLVSHIKHTRNPLNQKISAQSPFGDIPVAMHEIMWFEKVGRTYELHSKEKAFKIQFNLTELEAMLSKEHFYRINRAVIVNIAFVANITRWENEKYIVQLTNKKEFVVTRKRVVILRTMLEKLKK